MKAITVWQPWASLLACGAKQYETRSWATKYRGPIAIHSAVKRLDDDALWPLVKRALQEHQKIGLPVGYGKVIATAELVGCWRMDSLYRDGTRILWKEAWNGQSIYERISEQEISFGDWTPGRYAWEFANMKILDRPIPAKGRQGLWEWKEGDAL